MSKQQKKIKKIGLSGSIPVRSTKQALAQQGFCNSSTSLGRNVGQIKQMLSHEFNSKFSAMFIDYRPAKLYNAKGDHTKDWYVEYYYKEPTSATNFKRFKERFKINTFKNYSDKLMYGKLLVKFINKQLAAGFNPFNTIKKIEEQEYFIVSQLLRIKANMSSYASESQKATYTDVYNRFCKWIIEKNYNFLKVNTITIQHISSFKKWMLYDRNLSVKTANNTLTHLSMFMDVAIEEGLTLNNYFRIVPKAKKRDKVIVQGVGERFEPLTPEELKLIGDFYRKQEKQSFMNFLYFIYHGWARPIEIMRLRVMDIEMERGLIRFRRGATKNSNAAYIQIVPPLLEVIQSMKLHLYQPNDFLFGENYLPGTKKINKSLPSKHWRLDVKEKLNINKDMYALKHTGNIEYLLKNAGKVDLKWQQMQNRHSSPTVTQKYNNRIGVYAIELKDIVFSSF